MGANLKLTDADGDWILSQERSRDSKGSVFTGPMFQESDPVYEGVKSGKIELPNKLGAMQLLAKICGWQAPKIMTSDWRRQ